MIKTFAALAAAIFLCSICAGQGAGQDKIQDITMPNLSDVALSKTPIQIKVTTGSGAAATLKSDTPSVCTISSATLTLVNAGTCTITANAPAGGGFLAAQASESFQVTESSPEQFPGVDTVFGIGSLITGKHTDYKVNTGPNVLEGTQIGRASPQLLAGLAFQLPAPGLRPCHSNSNSVKKWNDACRPWHAFVSLKFSTDSTQTIVGYTFGITYRIQKYLDLLAGYSLTPFQEPSPGFRAAAAYVVASNPKLYPTFNAPAMNNNSTGAFDGFPLQCVTGAINCGNNSPSSTPAAGTSLYAGNALESHYRGGFVLGISVPVSLNGILGIASKTPPTTAPSANP